MTATKDFHKLIFQVYDSSICIQELCFSVTSERMKELTLHQSEDLMINSSSALDIMYFFVSYLRKI